MNAAAAFFPPGRLAVIAHRGASRAARENTVEAFEKAVALRADAVELDVRRTADGAAVVHHDAALPEVGVIADATLGRIRTDAPHVPTIEEALEACAGLWVDVEIKNLPVDPDWDPDETLAATIGRLVAATDLAARVLVSSFNPLSLVQVRSVAPDVATALLSVRGVDPVGAVEVAAGGGHAAVHPAVESLAGPALAATVEAARQRDLAVVPWTVDDPDEIARLAEAGVAGVITNVPDLARRVVGAG